MRKHLKDTMFIVAGERLMKIFVRCISKILRNVQKVFSDVRWGDSKKRWKAQLLFLIALNDYSTKLED